MNMSNWYHHHHHCLKKYFGDKTVFLLLLTLMDQRKTERYACSRKHCSYIMYKKNQSTELFMSCS